MTEAGEEPVQVRERMKFPNRESDGFLVLQGPEPSDQGEKKEKMLMYRIMNDKRRVTVFGNVSPESTSRKNRAMVRETGKRDLIKILGRGELKSGVSIQAHKFSASARTAIEAAGGEAAEA